MNYRFVDTHCHFDFPPFSGNEASALQLASESGVQSLIVPAVTSDRFQMIIDLSRQYSAIYPALGLHSIYIARHNEQALAQLEDYLKQPENRIVAIGEIGLDNYIASPQLEAQIALLKSQFQLAKRYDLPVILHSRKTHDLLTQLLRQNKLPKTGVVHGFSGSLEQAQQFIKLGYYIGVGGTITYARAQKTRNAIAALPLTSLLFETDAPDMPVAGFQGQPNRPEHLVQILAALSEIRRESKEQIAEQIYQNSLQLFSLR